MKKKRVEVIFTAIMVIVTIAMMAVVIIGGGWTLPAYAGPDLKDSIRCKEKSVFINTAGANALHVPATGYRTHITRAGIFINNSSGITNPICFICNGTAIVEDGTTIGYCTEGTLVDGVEHGRGGNLHIRCAAGVVPIVNAPAETSSTNTFRVNLCYEDIRQQ